MPGTTHVTSSSTDTPRPTGVRDDVDLDRTVWFGGGEAYHRATAWGPACPDKIGQADEHTLAEAAEEGLRPCKICEPVDYRRVATDGGRNVLTHDGTALVLPDDVDLSNGLVIRARGVTVDHKPGSPDHDAYPLSSDHLDADERLRNEQLDDFEVSLKPYGGEAKTYDVEIVATDGGVDEAPLEIHVRPRDGGQTSFELGEKTALRFAKMLDAGADEYADRVWPDNEDGKAKAIANTILRSFDEDDQDDRNAHADAVAAQLRLAEKNGDLPDGVSR